MTVPKPTGLTCRHAPGWGYITVPAKRGLVATVEYDDRGTWNPAAEFGTEHLVPIHQVGETAWRARYTRGGTEHSAWTTGRAWAPDGFAVDDDPEPPKPVPPHHLQSCWPTTGTAELSWQQPGTVDDWRVTVEHNGGIFFDRTVTEPAARVTGLAYDKPLKVRIWARAAGAESEPLRMDLPDFHWRPTTPENLAVTPGDTSLALEWEQPDLYQCQGWQVWWLRDGDPEPADGMTPEALDRAIKPGAHRNSGNVRVCGNPELLLEGLEPGTRYRLLIAAVWRTTSYSRGSISEYHTTTGGHDGPRKPVLRKGAVTETSIELLWDDDPGATGCWVRRGSGRHRHTAEPRWNATGLAPDSAYEFGVIAENKYTEQESDEATIVLTTAGSEPPPPPRPRPPQGLRAHCITAHSALIEWDDASPNEPVEFYRLNVVGEDAEREVIGTLMEVGGLEPETPHAVRVRACNPGACSEAAEVHFTTGEDKPEPDPDPPGQLPAPVDLMLDPVGPGEVDVTWRQPGTDPVWWLVSGDDLRTQRRVTRPRARVEVPPGQQRSIAVYAVADGNPSKLSQIVRKAVVTAVKGA